MDETEDEGNIVQLTSMATAQKIKKHNFKFHHDEA